MDKAWLPSRLTIAVSLASLLRTAKHQASATQLNPTQAISATVKQHAATRKNRSLRKPDATATPSSTSCRSVQSAPKTCLNIHPTDNYPVGIAIRLGSRPN